MFVSKENVYSTSNVCVASMNSCCLNGEAMCTVGDMMYINIVSTVGNENGLLFSYCNTLFCCDVRIR